MCPADRPEQELLDETWNAWSQLLSASEPALDERAVVAGIERRLARQAVRPRWRVAAAALLAASVMLAVCWSAWRNSGSDQGLAGRDDSDRVLPPAPMNDLTERNVADEGATPEKASDAQLFWDDEIGRELAVVRSEAWHVESEWGAGLDVAASISWRMDDLEREFAESSL